MHTLSAKQLRDRFLKGELKAEAIVDHFLKRIEAHDGSVGAFLKVYSERAKEQAKGLDQKRDRGEKWESSLPSPSLSKTISM